MICRSCPDGHRRSPDEFPHVVFGKGVINEVIGEEFLENIEAFSPPYTSSVLRRTTAFAASVDVLSSSFVC
jgi:hypothetical protein